MTKTTVVIIVVACGQSNKQQANIQKYDKLGAKIIIMIGLSTINNLIVQIVDIINDNCMSRT